MYLVVFPQNSFHDFFMEHLMCGSHYQWKVVLVTFLLYYV